RFRPLPPGRRHRCTVSTSRSQPSCWSRSSSSAERRYATGTSTRSGGGLRSGSGGASFARWKLSGTYAASVSTSTASRAAKMSATGQYPRLLRNHPRSALSEASRNSYVDPPATSARHHGFSDRNDHRQIQNYDHHPSVGTYRIHLAGKHLTLTVIHDTCTIGRAQVFPGHIWTKVG